jgi:hypothetical protein
MLEEPHKLHAKSQMIWAVLQCHRVVVSFSDVQFRGHTSIVKEMSLFMLTERVDPTELVGFAMQKPLPQVQRQKSKNSVRNLPRLQRKWLP